MIHTLPIQVGAPNYRIRTKIEQTLYMFDVRWNVRDVAWYFDLYDDQENPIRRGVKIVLGTYLGRACNDPPFSKGVFVATDTSGKFRDASFDDLGSRVLLRYFPQADLVQFLAAAGAAP